MTQKMNFPIHKTKKLTMPKIWRNGAPWNGLDILICFGELWQRLQKFNLENTGERFVHNQDKLLDISKFAK